MSQLPATALTLYRPASPTMSGHRCLAVVRVDDKLFADVWNLNGSDEEAVKRCADLASLFLFAPEQQAALLAALEHIDALSAIVASFLVGAKPVVLATKRIEEARDFTDRERFRYALAKAST